MRKFNKGITAIAANAINSKKLKTVTIKKKLIIKVPRAKKKASINKVVVK